MTSDPPNPISLDYLRQLVSLFDEAFSIDWLTGITHQKPSGILTALEPMVHNGWLEQAGPGRFVFCDTAQKAHIRNSIRPPDQARLFRSAALYFLKEFDESNVDPGILSKFLLHTRNDERGCRGLLMAGDAFVRNYQPEKALECYTKLKSDLLNLKGETVDALFMEMAVKTSKVSTARQSTTEVITLLEEALERALKRGDQKSEALIRMHIAKNEWLANRYDRAMTLFKEGWDLANRFDDARLLRSAMALRMYFSFWQGHYKGVVRYYEDSFIGVEKYPEKGFPLIAAITVGQCYTYTGQITQALGMLNAIHQSCRNEGDLHTAAFAISTINAALIMIKPIDETLALAVPAYLDIRQSGNQYVQILTEGMMAYLYYLKGDLDRSVEHLKTFVQQCCQVNIDTLHHLPYLLELCWAMEQGRYPRIMNLHIDSEVDKLLAGQNVFFKGLAYRYRALLEQKAGQPEKTVMKSLASSLKWLKVSGHELEILTTRFEIARQHLLLGRRVKAGEIIGKFPGVIAKYNRDLIPSDLKSFLNDAAPGRHHADELLRFGRQIMTASDGRDVVQRIILNVNHLTGAERGAIFLVKENGTPPELVLRASKNLTSEDVARPEFSSSIAFMQKVIDDPENQNKFIDHNKIPGQAPVTLANAVIRSRICVPILHMGRVKGVLYHDNRLLDSVFKVSDIALLSFYAGQAAIILDNLALRHEVRDLHDTMREERRYEEEQHYPAGRFEHIIGKSNAIQKTLHQVEQVAMADINVLILGETGSGKELIANAVHYHSARQGKPFVKANCSALTETLINSELFGHEKGAFTGASARRIGRFEMAHGGTLLLDEIGDLPLSVQANLLRTLQTHEFERVGSNKTIRTDFRLIAATNRDLHRMVAENRFRADLYFRLNVFPVDVPPLRDRKEDVPMLVHHFIQLFCKKLKRNALKVPTGEMKKLIRYDWPGNVRELENVVQRAIVMQSGGVFKTPELTVTTVARKSKTAAQTLREVERDHILWALEQKGWKIRGAGGVAELLGINPSTLNARMKKLDISRPRR